MTADPPLTLRKDVVYLSPSGRLCQWLPSSAEQRVVTTYAVFIYLDGGKRLRHVEAANWREGFHLTPANFRLLRVQGARA